MEESEFSGDETLFLFVALAGSLAGAVFWYARLVRTSLPRVSGAVWLRLLLACTPRVVLLPVLVVLVTWADPVYVTNDPSYILLFLAGGAAWVLLTARYVFPLLGLNVADDAIERGNPAAGAATVGASLAVALVYAGGNIGNGPTIWTTLVPAFFATVAFSGAGCCWKCWAARRRRSRSTGTWPRASGSAARSSP